MKSWKEEVRNNEESCIDFLMGLEPSDFLTESLEEVELVHNFNEVGTPVLPSEWDF